MSMNRIQFQHGLSLGQFFARFGTDEQCAQALWAARWPNGFVCPACRAPSEPSVFVRGRQRYWQCARCRHQCSLTAGTALAGTKLALRHWFLAMFLLTQSKNAISALELMRQLGVCYRTAWRVKHKLMQTMATREASRQLRGFVQIDDAFLGGERTGGKRGRGSENKIPFVAAVQTTPDGRPQFIRLDCLPNWRLTTLGAWAKRALQPATHVVSDGLSAFVAVREAYCSHEAIPHGTGKLSAQHPRFLWVNTILGNLKTALAGTYKGFKAGKYGQRYLAEFQYRFNRRFDLAALPQRLLHAACAQSPLPERLLRTAELRR